MLRATPKPKRLTKAKCLSKMWIRRAKRAKHRSVRNNFVLLEAVFEWILSFFFCILNFSEWFLRKASKQIALKQGFWKPSIQPRLDESERDESSQCCTQRWLLRQSVFPQCEQGECHIFVFKNKLLWNKFLKASNSVVWTKINWGRDESNCVIDVPKLRATPKPKRLTGQVSFAKCE